MAAVNFKSADGSVKSPSVRGGAQGASSPWIQMVQGDCGQSEVVPTEVVTVALSAASFPVSPSSLAHEQIIYSSPAKAMPEAASSPDDSCQPEGSDDGGSQASKKPVWNKPSNGIVEVVSPVIDAVSWPALGESTKASPKLSSSESLKALSDGSLPPALQVTGNSSPSPHKLAGGNNMNPTSTPNHVAPTRQKSMKRGGGSFNANVSANGGVSQPPLTSHDSLMENPHNTTRKPGTDADESSPRDHTQKESQRGGFGSQSNNGNDHHPQRGPYRRGNGGQHPRGDGSFHHSYGGKRDHDRGNLQHSRSFNSRDTHLQPQRGFARGYIPPSVHTSTPFIPPPMAMPVRSFGNNMMYPDVASPVIYVQGPPIPPPMYFAVPDPQLHAKIVIQINYYFSNENLVKDTYLRQNMDEQGWVPVNLIAGFKKVSFLTDNIQLILDAMRTSTVVEVQGDKIRRRNDWMRWIMHPPTQYSNLSSPQAIGRSPNYDALASQLQGVALNETTSKHTETSSSRSSSGEFSSHLPQAGGEATLQIGGQQADIERVRMS